MSKLSFLLNQENRKGVEFNSSNISYQNYVKTLSDVVGMYKDYSDYIASSKQNFTNNLSILQDYLYLFKSDYYDDYGSIVKAIKEIESAISKLNVFVS